MMKPILLVTGHGWQVLVILMTKANGAINVELQSSNQIIFLQLHIVLMTSKFWQK